MVKSSGTMALSPHDGPFIQGHTWDHPPDPTVVPLLNELSIPEWDYVRLYLCSMGCMIDSNTPASPHPPMARAPC